MSLESGVMRLPVEVLCLVLAHLDARSLQEAGGVCRSWKRIVSDDRSWRLAFQRTFTRLPFARLQPTRMPSSPSWTDSKAHRSTSWRQEFIDRLALQRQWVSTQQRRRLEFNIRASTVDQLVVCEKHGWALGVSRAGAAAVRCDPRTGKVFARDADTKDMVFACEPLSRVRAVRARVDRIFWALDDGSTSVTHLTPQGKLRSRVLAHSPEGTAAALDVAGPFDALAQRLPEWPAAHGVAADDVAATATADGRVYVWATDTGRLVRVLQGSPQGAPLGNVTWAEGTRYVAAATLGGRILVWDLHLDEATPTFVHDMLGAVVLLAGDPFSDTFVVATEANGVHRMTAAGGIATTFVPDPLPRNGLALITAAKWQVDARARCAPPSSATPPSGVAPEKREPAHVLRLDLAATRQQPSDSERSTRLLVVGDSQGSVWAFDADSPQRTTRPLLAWPRLHRCAVSAVASNAAVVVSAARDGHVQVLDPLAAQPLCALRCRGGRSERRTRRQRANPEPAELQNGPRHLDPWFWSVHPALIGEHTRNDVHLAQLLAARSSADWDRQIGDPTGDQLDREPAGDEVPAFFALQQTLPRVTRGFPTLVADVHAGYGWVVVANGTRIQSCFLDALGHSHRHEKQKRRAAYQSSRGLEREVAEDLARMRVETHAERQRRMERHAERAHVERTFIEPEEQLGLDPDEQIAYALWLSEQQQHGASPQTEMMTEDEQLQYALLLSQT